MDSRACTTAGASTIVINLAAAYKGDTASRITPCGRREMYTFSMVFLFLYLFCYVFFINLFTVCVNFKVCSF